MQNVLPLTKLDPRLASAMDIWSSTNRDESSLHRDLRTLGRYHKFVSFVEKPLLSQTYYFVNFGGGRSKCVQLKKTNHNKPPNFPVTSYACKSTAKLAGNCFKTSAFLVPLLSSPVSAIPNVHCGQPLRERVVWSRKIFTLSKVALWSNVHCGQPLRELVVWSRKIFALSKVAPWSNG